METESNIEKKLYDRISELQQELDKYKKENTILFNTIKENVTLIKDEYGDYQEVSFDIKKILLELDKYKAKEKELRSDNLIELLANIEHERWAGWQKYLHSLCIINKDGSLTISKDRVEWWNKEIETSYYNLDEKIKEYDRVEVRKSLKPILDILDKE